MRRILTAVALLTAAPAAVAQQPQAYYPQPRIETVFPLGARAGAAGVEVTVTGTDADDPTGLWFAHPGITAVPVPPPPAPKAKPGDKPKPPPAPGGAKFRVSVAADVPPGAYDVRLVNRWGVSNPRLFTVGTLPEVSEVEPNDDVFEAQRVDLGSVVNGVIGSPTDVDYVVFAGKKGQRVLAHCAATTIDSKAVPLVEVFGGDGRARLARNRQYRENDALADATLPADGDYYVRVTEFAHQRGGPDYFYRLTLSTGPWVDAVFPPAVEPGKPARVTLYGRNLPGGKAAPGVTINRARIETLAVTVNPPADPATLAVRGWVPPPTGLLDAFEYRLPGGNPVPVFLAGQSVVLEKEHGNDRPEGAEEVPVPCEVAGRIDRRGDRDWYAFAAKKGDVLMIELFADRIGANMDTYLTVRNAATGQEIAGEGQLDDDPETLHPQTFFTRTADPPPYRFTAPADGKYLVHVGSREAAVSYGPRAVYRLRIAPPRPDFRAVVMPRSRDLPAAAVVRADGAAAYDVFVDRRDGFAGPVAVTAEGLPPGVAAAPTVVGTRQRWGTLVLTGSAGLPDGVFPVVVKATAVIGGTLVTRTARPATITWGIPPETNVATITRLDQGLVLATRGDRAPFRLAADPAAGRAKGAGGLEFPPAVPLVLRPGDRLTVPVRVGWQEKEPRPGPVQVQMEPTDPGRPAPVAVNNDQPVPVPKDADAAAVTVDVRPNAPPGVYAVALHGETKVTVARDPAGRDKKEVSVDTFAPPLQVQVVPAALARLSAQTPAPVKPGATADVIVRVERLADFDGEFRVRLVLPEASGLTAADAVIPPGRSETRVRVTAARDAKSGPVINVPVQAVGVYDGRFPTAHETKINLTVAK